MKDWKNRLKDISDNNDMFMWTYEGVRDFIRLVLTTQEDSFIKIIDKHADPLYFRTLDCTNLDVEPPTTEKGMRWEESKKIFIKNVKAELEREDR